MDASNDNENLSNVISIFEYGEDDIEENLADYQEDLVTWVVAGFDANGRLVVGTNFSDFYQMIGLIDHAKAHLLAD